MKGIDSEKAPLMKEAVAAYRSGNVEHAKQCINVALQTDPFDPAALYLYSFLVNDVNKQVQLLERALQSDSTYGRARSRLENIKPIPNLFDELPNNIPETQAVKVRGQPHTTHISIVDIALMCAGIAISIIILLVLTGRIENPLSQGPTDQELKAAFSDGHGGSWFPDEPVRGRVQERCPLISGDQIHGITDRWIIKFNNTMEGNSGNIFTFDLQNNKWEIRNGASSCPK